MKKTLIFIFLALLLSTPARAADFFEEQAENFGVSEVEEAIPEEARDMLEGVSVKDALEPESFFGKIMDKLTGTFSSLVRSSLRSAVAVVCVSLICGLVSQLAQFSAPKYVTMAGVLATAVIAVGGGSFISSATETIEEITAFSHTLLPCLCAAAAAGGAITSAAAKYAATALFLDIFITAARNVLVPLVYTYFAASTAAAALDSPALDGAANLAKWLCNTAMTIIMTAFTVYLTVSGTISASADVLASKAAKTAISTVLPVVGGIISDAAGAVVTGAGLISGAVGVFGLAVVLCVCLVPFLHLGTQYLAFKAAAALTSSFAGGRLGSYTGAIGSTYGMLMGVVGSGAVMLFLAIVSMIKVVVV